MTTDTINGPAYLISSNGFRYIVGYFDGWCYGPNANVGYAGDWDQVVSVIKADIRRHWDERNGLPLYTISDHGNIGRSRAIRLRKR